jgi:hypothetical protein
MTAYSKPAPMSWIPAMAEVQASRVRAHKRGVKAKTTQSRQEGRN